MYNSNIILQLIQGVICIIGDKNCYFDCIIGYIANRFENKYDVPMRPVSNKNSDRSKHMSSSYEHFTAKAKETVCKSQKAGISIVNSQKNGKRICISAEVLNKIGFDWDEPSMIEIIPYGENIAIGRFPVFGTDGHPFSLKRQGEKGLIYSAPLVRDISEHLELNFDRAVCITLKNVRYKKNSKGKFALILKEGE